MKFSKPLLVVMALLVAACSSPTEPEDPGMVILEPQANARLKLGSTVTIRWECRNCAISANQVKVKLNSEGRTTGEFHRVAVVMTGFLSDSRPWTVGRYELLYGPEPQPGFYYLEVSSYPPPNEDTWTEATSGFGGVLVELVP